MFWGFVFRWWRLLIIVALASWVVSLFFTHTIVIISVGKPTNSQNTPVELTKLNGAGLRTDVLHIGSIALIARDTDRIEGRVGNWQTSVDITPLPFIGVKQISLTIDRDRNADKVSGGSLGCSLYLADTDKVASYACNNPNGLFIYKTSSTDGVPWKTEPLLTFPQAYLITPYGSGVLGIENSSSPRLFYADIPTKKISLPALPHNFDVSHLGGTSIVTDTTAPSDHFLLVDSINHAIYFANTRDGVFEYQRYTPDERWFSEGSSTQCVLRHTTAYCYVGHSSTPPDSHTQTEEHEQRTDGRFITINFREDDVEYSVSTVLKDEPIDQLYVDNRGQVYARSDFVLYSLDATQSKLRRTVIAPSVGSVAGGDNLYYIVDNRLFEFDSETKTTNMRFFSDNLRLSTINQFGSKTFFNAFAENSPGNTLHTYQLLEEQNIYPGERLVDKLPVYPEMNQAPIIDIDYYRNVIHVVLPDYVTYNKGGKIVSDQKRFQEARQIAINYLSNVVPSLHTYTLTFSRPEN